MRAVFAVLFVTAGLTLSPARAFAQETTGTIEGQVVDAQGLPVPSATVSVSSGQGVASAVTNSQGRFRIPFLTPGVMGLKVEFAGFKTLEQKGLVVRLGQMITLNLQLEVAGLTAEVEVQAETPVIDTTTTTLAANLDIERLTREPVGRRVSDTLYITPGVASSGSAGAANPSIAGGSELDNQYVIDGMNVTNTGFGGLGSYSIVFGSLGTATPFDFVKEVQVKTGGFEAEFGQATGGLVNVVTKSGTNDVRGSAFGRFSEIRPWGPTDRSASVPCSDPTHHSSASWTNMAAKTRQSPTAVRCHLTGCLKSRSRARETRSSKRPRSTRGGCRIERSHRR